MIRKLPNSSIVFTQFHSSTDFPESEVSSLPFVWCWKDLVLSQRQCYLQLFVYTIFHKTQHPFIFHTVSSSTLSLAFRSLKSLFRIRDKSVTNWLLLIFEVILPICVVILDFFNKLEIVSTYRQWRSQLDNLVPLCKLQVTIIIHFFRNCCELQTVNEHEHICIAGLSRGLGTLLVILISRELIIIIWKVTFTI